MKHFLKLNRRSVSPLLVGLSLCASLRTADAALPELEPPSRTGDTILAMLQNYGYDIVALVALLVIAAMFLGVCYHAYSSYSEIHTGRKTWGDFGLTVSVGAILLVIGIWLLTRATDVLL